MKRSAHSNGPFFHRLPSSIRLKKQSLIRPLFDRSRNDVGSIAKGSIRLLYRVVPRRDAGADVQVQVGFATGRASSAVLRNRIKRVMREVYRVNQESLTDLFSDTPALLTLMILFRGRSESAAHEIRHDLPISIRELIRRLSESSMIVEQR